MIKKEEVIEILQTCYDPEIPIDLWNLGINSNISINEDNVDILMTLTTPGCTMADVLAQDVKNKLLAVKSVAQVNVKTTFEPVWEPNMMTDLEKKNLI